MAGFTQLHKKALLRSLENGDLFECPYYDLLEMVMIRHIVDQFKKDPDRKHLYLPATELKVYSEKFKRSVWFEPSNSRSKALFVYAQSLPLLQKIVDAYDRPYTLAFPAATYNLPATTGALRWFGAKMGLSKAQMDAVQKV
jgi:hypothetical protein